MKKIHDIRKALNDRFVERAEVIDGMLTALLAKENLFLLGPPGTGKSALTETLCSSIQGGKFFGYVMGKFTTPEELFGPVSLSGLQNGLYERVTSQCLPEADIGFIDEIWKGSSANLNTLLPIINERVFRNPAPGKIPLQVLFAASNEIPEGEELAAMYDRFALKYVTDRIKSDDHFRSMLAAAASPSIPQITLADLAKEQAAAQSLQIPRDVMDALIAIRRDVDADGMYVSDRKWVQAIKVIRAYAHLQGHSAVELEDLDILEAMLWTTPDSRRAVSKLVQKHTNPIGEKLGKIQDAIAEISTTVEAATTSQAAELVNKLKKLKVEMLDLGSPEKNAKLAATLKDCEKVQYFLLTKKLGLSV